MSNWEIWHNPRCSKSRQTLQLLQDNGVEPTVKKYLDDPPSVEQLDEVLSLLGMEPKELVRTKEAVFKELGLGKSELSREEWLKVMVENPKLLERPVVIHEQQAAVGRPPENVLALLK
ncbi:MAG: arsenate reductase (glutaredoxin) [Deltaproteobacteria bacterium]|nr:MAG: arsenate reductase (glutaredoxin) [Deltaproteobacteria bacterium]